MTELIERVPTCGLRNRSDFSHLITLGRCVALFLQSRLDRRTIPVWSDDRCHIRKIIWVAWFALGVSLALLVYECRKECFVRWVAGAFLVFHLADLLDRELALRTFSTDYPWWSNSSPGQAPLQRQFFVAGSHLRTSPHPHRPRRDALRATTNSASSPPRNPATIPSSSTTVSTTAAGEICDFKFTSSNGNAERMIGMDRSAYSGNNLYEVFPTIRTTDLFERHKRVAETGEAGPHRGQEFYLQPEGELAVTKFNVKLSNGIATTITDVTSHFSTQGRFKACPQL